MKGMCIDESNIYWKTDALIDLYKTLYKPTSSEILDMDVVLEKITDMLSEKEIRVLIKLLKFYMQYRKVHETI